MNVIILKFMLKALKLIHATQGVFNIAKLSMHD